jgi:hypothetical protein
MTSKTQQLQEQIDKTTKCYNNPNLSEISRKIYGIDIDLLKRELKGRQEAKKEMLEDVREAIKKLKEMMYDRNTNSMSEITEMINT